MLSPRCTDAVMHTPEEVTMKALSDARQLGADCLVRKVIDGAEGHY